MHPAALPPDVLLNDCEIRRTRRGGPGGQHRNKVETAVVIKHRPTGAVGAASERRSQDLNRQAALQRLRVNLSRSKSANRLSQNSLSVKHGTPASITGKSPSAPNMPISQPCSPKRSTDWQPAIGMLPLPPLS